MPTVILHIGQTKTATSSLQAFLKANRAVLAGHGILYPLPWPEHPAQGQHRFLVESLYAEPGRAEAAWHFLAEQIEAAAQPRVLISEEVFWHLFEGRPARRPETLAWIRSRLPGCDWRVVVDLRRQDHWIESWHKQLVKTDVSALSGLALEPFVQVYEDMGMLDYGPIVGDWAAAFGTSAVCLREFGTGAEPADPVQGFMAQVLGITDLEGFAAVPAQQTSLAAASLDFAQHYNRLPGAARFKPAHRQMLKSADPMLLDRRRRLSAASANRLWRRCQAANQALATRHGLGEAGLFRDWVLQPEPELPLQGGLPDGEHWTLLAQMFIRHEDRLARLQRRIDELEASLTQASAADLSSRG